MPTIVDYLQISPMREDLEGFLINGEFIFGHSLITLHKRPASRSQIKQRRYFLRCCKGVL